MYVRKVNVAAPDVGILLCLESGTRWKHTCSRSLALWLHCTEKMDKQQGRHFVHLVCCIHFSQMDLVLMSTFSGVGTELCGG